MAEWLKFSFNGTDVDVEAALELTNQRLIEATTARMQELMKTLQTRLQARAPRRALVPGNQEGLLEVGGLARSIRDPRAYLDGTSIRGELTIGGDLTTVSYKGGRRYDVARIVTEGHRGGYPVNPLTKQGTRLHEKGAKRRKGADILRFFRGGEKVFATFTFPEASEPNPFIKETTESMRREFSVGIRTAIKEAVKKK